MEVLKFVILINVFRCSAGENISSYQNLHDVLFGSYNSDLRPVPTDCNKLKIFVMFHLFAINDFNEVEGTLSVVGAVSIIWTDPSLTWNSTEYNGLESITVPQTRIWTPDVVLRNDANRITPLGSGVSFSVTINCNGKILWTPGSIFDAKCSAEISKFPFDSHACVLWFSGWGLHDTVEFHPTRTSVSLSHFLPNRDWNLISHSMDNHNSNVFTVTLGFKRKPAYYNVIVFTPTAVLALLNPLLFLLPIDCGERLSFGMTILLSHVVFLTLVSSQIPATSNPISFLIIYIILLFVVSAAITVCNIININLWLGTEDCKVGGVKRKFVLFLSCRLWKGNVSSETVKKDVITSNDFVKLLDKFYIWLYYCIIILLIVVYFLMTTT